jgi:hypothetical protein
MRYRFHTGLAIATGGKFTPHRFVNDLACFPIGSDPWAAPAAALPGIFDISHAFT